MAERESVSPLCVCVCVQRAAKQSWPVLTESIAEIEPAWPLFFSLGATFYSPFCSHFHPIFRASLSLLLSNSSKQPKQQKSVFICKARVAAAILTNLLLLELAIYAANGPCLFLPICLDCMYWAQDLDNGVGDSVPQSGTLDWKAR